MMGVSSCMSVRQVRGGCHCPACPRASGHGVQMPPQTLVLPPMALEPETTPVKDKKGSKMKVLKKIKRKIGLAPRTSCTGGAPNNLPPLSFHAVHGENVRVSRDGSTARRVESFCKGVAFSARPVRVNEKVCIRFVEISNSWSGVIRFGFTTNDPTGLAHALPKYACPDLTNKPGNWAKALGERFCEKDNVLHYSVNSAGDVHFGVNGEDKGLFFSGVDTRSPLWALVDVYGNCTAVAFADPRAPRRDPDALLRGLRALSVSAPRAEPRVEPRVEPRAELPAPRHAQPLAPLPLHRTRGRNVCEANERGEAARADAEFCQGYVFSARPLRPGQTVVVQILATDESSCAFAGSLAVGLTACDPAALRPDELPDDAEQLLDRPEYWVVKRDAADGLRRGDELAVTLTPDGEVRVSRNGAAPAPAMHVDHSLRLWAFVDIYGATTRVRLWRSQAPSPPPLRLCAPGAVLVVSLPPHYEARAALAGPAPPGPALAGPALYEARAASAGPPAHYEARAAPPGPLAPPAGRRCASSSQNSCNEQLAPAERRAGAECTICYEQAVDSVLYMCGHMCMCYRCAVQQWRGKGGGQCPLCRAQIKDVIRTYKS